MKIVIDSNVLAAANRRDTHAEVKCASACAALLLGAIEEHIILEDTADLIWNEYKRKCNFSGQPGVGDRFFLWFLQNRWTVTRVQRVDIGGDPETIEALLPVSLRTFDRDDHMWIAVYLEGGGDIIYNALDSDWKEYADEISAADVTVKELCPQELKAVKDSQANLDF